MTLLKAGPVIFDIHLISVLWSGEELGDLKEHVTEPGVTESMMAETRVKLA